MNTPPAFQLYAGDFLTGISAMAQAEVGAYFLLLLHQWNHGSIPTEAERQQLIARGPVPEIVLSKFQRTSDGRLVNQRMELEREKSIRHKELYRAKGLAGAASRLNRARAQLPPQLPPQPEPKTNSSSSPSGNAEREQPFPEVVDRPKLEEVLAFAAMGLGLAPWKAEDWFNEMQGCGWLDHYQRPIRDWKAVLIRVKAKWEADGRPAGPPTARTGGTSSTGQPMRINELRQVMEAKERQAQELRRQYATEGPLGDTWSEQAKRVEYIQLRRDIKALNTRIATAA